MCKYSDISDHDLDHLVRDIQYNNPNIATCMVQGYLKSRGIFIEYVVVCYEQILLEHLQDGSKLFLAGLIQFQALNHCDILMVTIV